MDGREYYYDYGNNQLSYVTDKYGATNYASDIDEQSYITEVRWTVYGKIAGIRKSGEQSGVEKISTYDASGNRISKRVYNANTGVENTT